MNWQLLIERIRRLYEARWRPWPERRVVLSVAAARPLIDGMMGRFLARYAPDEKA